MQDCTIRNLVQKNSGGVFTAGLRWMFVDPLKRILLKTRYHPSLHVVVRRVVARSNLPTCEPSRTFARLFFHRPISFEVAPLATWNRIVKSSQNSAKLPFRMTSSITTSSSSSRTPFGKRDLQQTMMFHSPTSPLLIPSNRQSTGSRPPLPTPPSSRSIGSPGPRCQPASSHHLRYSVPCTHDHHHHHRHHIHRSSSSAAAPVWRRIRGRWCGSSTVVASSPIYPTDGSPSSAAADECCPLMVSRYFREGDEQTDWTDSLSDDDEDDDDQDDEGASEDLLVGLALVS